MSRKATMFDLRSGGLLSDVDAQTLSESPTMTISDLNASAGGGGGLFDHAALTAYTLSAVPNGSFPETNIVVNGTSQAGLLTHPVAALSEESGFNVGYLGWQGSQLASPLDIGFDFGAAVEVSRARVAGMFDTGQQIRHPASLEVFWSDDGAAYTPFGSIVGLSDTGGGENQALWWMTVEAAAESHQYWRCRIARPDPGAGDNWTMISNVQLLGSS